MNAAELLAELEGRSVRLDVADNGLRYAAPKGALTAELRAAMADRKVELLAILAPPPNRPAAAPSRACRSCGVTVGPHAYRCASCLAWWRNTTVPWCAATDCRRPQSGGDQGFCSPEHREQTERDRPW